MITYFYLQVGDQILSINDESSIGISREQAVNILRSAAATNQVRFRIKHFPPQLPSAEYQNLLYDEKSTDDEDSHRMHNISQNRNNNNTTDELRKKKASRRHHRHHHHHQNQDQSNQQSVYNVSYENRKHEQQERNNQFDISHDSLQALLNSRFKIIDLVDLLKKIYPQLLFNDQKRELQFIEQLSENNTGE